MKKLLFSLSSLVVFVLVVLGCSHPKAIDKYHITVLGDSKQISVDQAWIHVELNDSKQISVNQAHVLSKPGILVDTMCDHPLRKDLCSVRIFWFYPKDSLVEFTKGIFVARDIKNHSIIYGTCPTGVGYTASRGRSVNMESGMSVSFGLKELPKEFELVMPKLKVNGVEKKLPILYFKHYQGFKKEPFININS